MGEGGGGVAGNTGEAGGEQQLTRLAVGGQGGGCAGGQRDGDPSEAQEDDLPG